MFINAQFIAAPHIILEAEHQMNAGIAEPVKGSYTPKTFLWLECSHQCLVLHSPVRTLNQFRYDNLVATRIIRLQRRPNHPNRHLGRPTQQQLATHKRFICNIQLRNGSLIRLPPTNLLQARISVIDSLV